MTVPTEEEIVERLTMALAELGWGGFPIRIVGTTLEGWPEGAVNSSVPEAVWWQAVDLVYPPGPCWSCTAWNSGSVEMSIACSEGNCSHPDGPHKPPRELLVKNG